MDIYVHIAVGAAVGVFTKRTANRIFPALEEECDQSVSCKLAHAIEWATVYGAGVTGGLVSHVLLDMLPHGDYLAHYGLLIPDSLWLFREFLVGLFVVVLITLLLRGRSRLIALAAGIGGTLLELDNLAIGMGWIKRSQAISPSHSGVWPHGQNIGVPSLIIELGMFLLAMGYLYVSSRRKYSRSVRMRQTTPRAVVHTKGQV